MVKYAYNLIGFQTTHVTAININNTGTYQLISNKADQILKIYESHPYRLKRIPVSAALKWQEYFSPLPPGLHASPLQGYPPPPQQN